MELHKAVTLAQNNFLVQLFQMCALLSPVDQEQVVRAVQVAGAGGRGVLLLAQTLWAACKCTLWLKLILATCISPVLPILLPSSHRANAGEELEWGEGFILIQLRPTLTGGNIQVRMGEHTCDRSGQQVLAASGCIGLLPLSNSINCFTHMRATLYIYGTICSHEHLVKPNFLSTRAVL